ncbi:MFS transporter [Phytoactinopolyspora mesophila]|uniref:MFS transporter n=1 Tax=Phytoactinopolyspora mesophila TaxID=2650750 RepID=A0A7K3M7Q6_9ACTN|nr:MFS transporter [Phytoactinopolyspora mesophila]NDL59349.1 MFS transporter [Phytoactinopolyspora mesophila]
MARLSVPRRRNASSAPPAEGAAASTSPVPGTVAVDDSAVAPAPAESRPPLGRGFLHLWAASGISNLGDGILLIGGPLLAVTVTRSPFLVSLVTAAIWLPWLLFALHAGAVADRYDRRRIMMVASWSRATGLLLAVVFTAIGELNLPVLYAAVLLVGIAEVFSDTSAQSMLPMIVPKSRLGDANGRLIAAQTVANNFLGAPLAGVLVGVAAASVFGAAGLCYALAGLLLLRIRGRHRVESVSTQTMRADIGAGLRYLWAHSLLRNLATSAGLINFGSNAYMAVFVLWVVGDESEIGLTPAGYGIVASVLGLGAVLGSLVVERVTRKFGASQTLIGALLLMSCLLLAPVVAPSVAVLVPAAVGIGACGAATNVIVVSMRQRLVPEELLGRVNASYRMIGMGGIPAGAVGGGVLGSAAGLPVVFFSAVGLCVVAVGLVAYRVSPRALAAAELRAAQRETARAEARERNVTQPGHESHDA